METKINEGGASIEPPYKSENALENIDIIKNNGFECNGKVYFLEPHISKERFDKMTKFELELSYSINFKTLYKKLSEVYDVLNEGKFADSSVKIRDLLEGITRLDDKNNHHPILKYCACILNTEDEDRRSFDEKKMNDKIQEWQEAGIPMSSFFALVLHSVSGLVPSYHAVVRDILGIVNPEQNENEKTENESDLKEKN